MRESLRKSAGHSPAKGFERYHKGSIVLCNACSKPIFKLDRVIAFGDRMGQTASAFKPLDVIDLAALAGRDDIDAGIRAWVSALDESSRAEHCGKLREMRTGDPTICPCCGCCFVQVTSVEKHEALDKAYTVELLTIPPHGVARPAPVRGKHLGARREWLN